MVEKKMYDNIDAYMADNLKPITKILENKEEIKEQLKVGNNSLVNLMVNCLETAVHELSGKYLTEEKEIFFRYWIAFHNTINDIDFVNYYAGDMQKWLKQIYPKECTNLCCLEREDFKKAFTIAVNEEKVPELLEIYHKNPHLELTAEQIRSIKAQKELKQKLPKNESTDKVGDVDKQKLKNKFFKRIAIMGALVLGVSTFISYQSASNEEKQKELETIVQTVEEKYGDTDKDGSVDEREKLKLYEDIAKQNNAYFVNGEFNDKGGDLIDRDKLINWFKNYNPSEGFGKIYGVDSKTLEKNKQLYESTIHKENKGPTLK
ncbi:MAG: hypothetical protein KKA65_01175 [Nanoarchaeota archaeon]|nr:hypothetical protein [Nanoarchaeota archaeon]MBU4456091.1 hypothetical protein [Nanoarchaeota archaeon]MCG2719919.1 hypothetical protein [Nanoarchaeota archaeon]